MTSDRGNTGGAELTTPVHTDYLVPWENGPNGVLQYEKPVVGLNPNATVFQTKTDQWDGLNSNEFQYTNANGDVGKEQGGVITPTLSPLPDLAISSQMVYPNDAGIDNGEDPLLELDDEAQKRQLIKTQLEVCLSRENLASDTYLQSQMDADQYVPIATIAQLQQIQQLTNNLELILELLKELPNVQVDDKGEKVRPNHNRCTVILREIPDTTPLEVVKDLFASDKCPKFSNVEFAHNSNWFVTFESDADAQSAYQYLREEVKTFLGKPIMARIKAKPLIKVTYPRNGYQNRFRNAQQQQMMQQQQQATQQTQQSTDGQQPQQTPPFQVQQQVPLMSTNIPNYSQQTLPFFANPNIIQWQTSPPILDPSMVLAINGYHATSVKLNTTTRTPFTSVTRNNRNPRQSNLRNQERGNIDNRPSHDRQPQSHRTSPRMSDNQQISGHHSYQSQSRRAMDNNANHSHILQTTNIDNNSNITAGRQSDVVRYKSRRREPPRNGNTRLQQYNNSRDKPEPQFDFEMNSFPPLPGPSTTSASTSTSTTTTSTASNEVFESKLSDVVKGTAKPQVRETKPQTNTSVSPQPASPATQPRPATPPQPQKDNSNNSSSAINGTSAISSQSSTPTRVPSPPPVSPPQKSQKTPTTEPPQQQKIVEVVQTPVKVAPVSNTQVKVVEKVEKERPSPAKLSYAQMVQKGRENEENTADGKPDDLSDNSGNESPQCSRKTLKEQSQTQKPAASHTPSKEHGRREYEPKEQRHGNGRRAAKENRIDRRDRRRDRNDHEGSRSSVSSTK